MKKPPVDIVSIGGFCIGLKVSSALKTLIALVVASIVVALGDVVGTVLVGGLLGAKS